MWPSSIKKIVARLLVRQGPTSHLPLTRTDGRTDGRTDIEIPVTEILGRIFTTGRPERLFTKLEHFHQIRARFLKKHYLTMRCRWCLLRQHFELCVIYMFENKRTPALHISSTRTDEKAQFTVCNTRGAVCNLTKRSCRSSRRAAWRKR